MRYFPRLLAHSKANVVKEAAWTISNVTAGNLQQIQAVIDAGLLGPVLEVLQKVGGRCGDGGGGRGGASVWTVEVGKCLCGLLRVGRGGGGRWVGERLS